MPDRCDRADAVPVLSDDFGRGHLYGRCLAVWIHAERVSRRGSRRQDVRRSAHPDRVDSDHGDCACPVVARQGPAQVVLIPHRARRRHRGAAAFGMVDFSPVASKGWLGLPTFLPYGPFTFDWKIFIPFFIAYMVAVMEALGVYQAASEIQGTSLERKQVRYGLAGEAAGSAISSLIGGFTTTAYPQNVGLLNLTGEGKLRTRTPVIIAAVLLLILGFVPKAGALLSVIPSAVVGGIFLPAAASLIVTGLRALRKVADDERRQTVIGMSLLLGIALPKALSGLTGGASVFFGNNIMVGVFSAIILNALFVALPDLVAKHRAPASVDVPAADPADGTGAAAYDER